MTITVQMRHHGQPWGVVNALEIENHIVGLGLLTRQTLLEHATELMGEWLTRYPDQHREYRVHDTEVRIPEVACFTTSPSPQPLCS